MPECPNCHKPIPRLSLFVKAMWTRWRCAGCGALLGIDVRRRLLAVVPWIGILALLLFVVRITTLAYPLALLIVCIAGVLNFCLFDRVVVHERTGFRCRQCGYDLQGQTEGRCPECGAKFDMDGLSAHKAAGATALPKVSRLRSALVTVVVACLLTGLFVAGILFARAARVGAARRPTTTSQAVRPRSTSQSTPVRPRENAAGTKSAALPSDSDR
ncbi:MAG: hypothetical protein ABII12_05670 [Planctomycetota bacterium]